MTVYEVADCMIVADGEEEAVDECLSVLSVRKQKRLRKELNQTDRRELDDIIFAMINLTKGEIEAVYEAVIDLVESRLKKARSV